MTEVVTQAGLAYLEYAGSINDGAYEAAREAVLAIEAEMRGAPVEGRMPRPMEWCTLDSGFRRYAYHLSPVEAGRLRDTYAPRSVALEGALRRVLVENDKRHPGERNALSFAMDAARAALADTVMAGSRRCPCTVDAELGAGSTCPSCGHRDHGRSGCAG